MPFKIQLGELSFKISVFIENLSEISKFKRVHIAVTKLHTRPGMAELFVNDMKASVKKVMDSPDRKNGKTVNYR